MNNLDLYKKALSEYGFGSQSLMVSEECGELLSALGKFQRGRASVEDVITEIADVMIMMEQMAVCFGYDEVLKEKERKLIRLEENLKTK